MKAVLTDVSRSAEHFEHTADAFEMMQNTNSAE